MLYSWVQASRRGVFLGLVALAFTAGSALAQAGSVAGRVRTPTGEPLANAQVSVVGTNLSATTDANGAYRIANVPPGTYTLRGVLVGYRPVSVTNLVVAAGVPATADLTMVAAPVQLEEVVVTALGIHREQRRLSYAAQVLSESKLTDVPISNVVSTLQGNVAGVHVTNSANPFGSARITVRGASSILGENQPLFIVDGVPIDNSAASVTGYSLGGSMGGYDVGNGAADINPNNIESMTVLKGPNAAALYGSRAANGAIVITTRKGAGVPGEGGLGLTATFGVTTETPLKLPAYQNQYGQGFYGDFSFVDGNGGGVNDYADESWGPKLDGRPIDQFFGKQQPWVAHPDNVRDFWETGVVTTLNMAVARATTRNNVRLSFGRMNEAGMYPSNVNARTDVGLAGGTQLSEHWSAEGSLNYIYDTMKNQPAQQYEETDPMQGFIWFGRQVDTKILKENLYRDPNDQMTKDIIAGGFPGVRTDAPIQYSWNYSYHPNPYWEAQVKTTDFQRNRVLGHGSATYSFSDWLSVTGRVGRDWYRNHMRAEYPVNNISPRSLGGLNDIEEARSETNGDFLITASNRPLLSNLSVTVNAGGNLRQNDYFNSNSTVTQLVIPGVYTLANSAGVPAVNITENHKKVNSLYGSASFTYHDWFTLDLTGRNDWSSTLPKNKNSFFYPSVGGALVFTDALGMNSSFLPYGKLRASWTRVGNDTDPYQLAAVYGAGTAWGGQPSFTAPNQLPNASLKPEETTGLEFGADLGLLNNRVTMNGTWYQKSTTNQILPVTISSATGYTSAVVNSGEVRNRGLELSATIRPVETRDFSWNLVANWSKNTNKVISLYAGVQRIVIGNYWNVNVTADSGAAYGNLVGYKWMRDTTIAGNPIVVGSDGLPLRDAKQTVLGNYNPDWVGGVTNTFTYKDLSLSIAFDGQKGGSVYSVTKWFGQQAGVLAGTLAGREEDWDQPGYVVPNAVYQNGTPDTTHVLAQDYFHNQFYANEDGVIDATYLKLRDVRLAWNLPSKVAQTLGFSGATLAIVGHNLMLWDKQDIIDPETTFDTGNRQGVENGQLPTARTIGFTLSVRP